MSEELKLGQKITVNTYLYRSSEMRDQGQYKYWNEFKSIPKEVMVIGLRTLSNGYNQYLADYGNVFYPDAHLSAVLVVENLRSKPFYILHPSTRKEINQ